MRLIVRKKVDFPHPEGPMMGMHAEHRMHMEHGGGEEHQAWTYYAGPAATGSPVTASAAAKSGKHSARTYTNADVERVGQISQDFKKK